MANHASALKAHRQNLKRRARNRSNRSELRTTLKKFNKQLADGTMEEAGNSLPAVYSAVDKAVQKKVLSRNAAARYKSRLSKRLHHAPAPTSTSGS